MLPRREASSLCLVTAGAVRLFIGRSGVGSASGQDEFLQPVEFALCHDRIKLNSPIITFHVLILLIHSSISRSIITVKLTEAFVQQGLALEKI
ncbi:hypothetical protein [Paenibacillus sp. IITD108]|uniref:hypothetical protein n=1 Tax=Paenibacillus sp. IITD108 TaxID=3116649 RepID=UPI002F40DD61